MLFFIDETWQNVGGKDVGAMAAAAIPRRRYNAFSREIWSIKQNVLGADQLSDCEIKGTNCFAKSAFKKKRETGHSKLLQAAEETLAAVPKYGGVAFAVWTDDEEFLLLKNPNPNSLSPPYRDLMHDFKRRMERLGGSGREGLLFFDNRGYKEDLGAACAIQNFIARVGPEWRKEFMQTPHFTPSAVSPGIQAADLIAYLAAHQHDPSVRPELHPYWGQVREIAFQHNHRRALRAVNADRHRLKGKGRRGQTP